ncbi:MAG: hypothetical protein PVS3B3_12300 [Ktedonobacteraceae bacterium]
MLNEPRGFQPNDTTFIDEHDEPTEPMRRADVAAFVPTMPDTVLSSNEEDVPAPKSSTQPFPYHYVQPTSSIQDGSQYTPPSSSLLPAKPNVSHENSPGGGILTVQPEVTSNNSQRKKVRTNAIPIAIGMCFVALQTLLLLRFLLKIVGISSDNAWVGAVYEVSNVFVLPFRALFLQLAIPLLFTVELYTLLAIFAYGVVSRIVVHTLKALLRTRQNT